jgi:hypothetical protein
LVQGVDHALKVSRQPSIVRIGRKNQRRCRGGQHSGVRAANAKVDVLGVFQDDHPRPQFTLPSRQSIQSRVFRAIVPGDDAPRRSGLLND